MISSLPPFYRHWVGSSVVIQKSESKLSLDVGGQLSNGKVPPWTWLQRPLRKPVSSKSHFAWYPLTIHVGRFGHDLNRLKPIYEKSRYSFLETIRPNARSRNLINLAKQELTRVFTTHYELPARDDTDTSAAVYVGVHIRRGDSIPKGWKYYQKPIPTKVFADAVAETWNRLHEGAADIAPAVYLASDSPDSIKEFASLVKGPLFSLMDSKLPDLKSIASDEEYRQKPFGLLPAKKRVSLTRGAVVDLALISGLWDSEREAMLLDATVCAVRLDHSSRLPIPCTDSNPHFSSNFCRLAAIGLSWEDAFGDVNDMGDIDKKWKRWVDVDLEGRVVPVWTAFELF